MSTAHTNDGVRQLCRGFYVRPVCPISTQGDGNDARFDLPFQDPIATLRSPVPEAVLATVATEELHDIIWYAATDPYGVSTIDD